MTDRRAFSALALATLAFTACFAAWMLNGVLVTFLVDRGVFALSRVQMGFLLGIPVLTGSITRLPVGGLTDRFGGRRVYTGVLLIAAAGLFLLSFATSFAGLIAGSLAFGMAGASFAVGVAYTSSWFPQNRQGTALGIFGAGNAGAALTSLLAPRFLGWLTAADVGAWRWLPRVYGVGLLLMALVFWLLAQDRPRVRAAAALTLRSQLQPLRSVRVWRFGVYYFFVFGCFVGLAQWLTPYYVNVFGVSLATAGALTAVFSFPSGVVRAIGGFLSDRYGARATMYAVLGVCALGCFALSLPPMQMQTPGLGIAAEAPGRVTAVEPDAIVVGQRRYPLHRKASAEAADNGTAPTGTAKLLPSIALVQEAVVAPGAVVQRKQLLARGVTHLSFVPNIYLFTAIVLVVGLAMGIGKAAVYKHIPDYFPDQVGVVGGMVGVLGGLGGFACPILFGALLEYTGLWSSCWIFLALLSLVCLAWMHSVVRHLERGRSRAMEVALRASGIDFGNSPAPALPAEAVVAPSLPRA